MRLGIKHAKIPKTLGNKLSKLPHTLGDKNGYNRVDGIISPHSSSAVIPLIEDVSGMSIHQPTGLRKHHHLEKK